MGLLAQLRPLVDKLPRLAAAYRTIRDGMRACPEPVETPWGFRFVGSTAMAAGEFEPQETKLVRDILKDMDVLVNIGANVGYYCCHALSLNKKVVAFEPMSTNLHYLYRNIRINNWTDIEVYPVALSDKTGLIEIYGGGTGASILKGWADTPESYVSTVPAATLDIILGNRLAGKRVFVIADVEGAENLMLAGAGVFLSSSPKPIWLIEIAGMLNRSGYANDGADFINTFKKFFNNGYRAFAVGDESFEVDMAKVEEAVRSKAGFPVYNFLFK